MTGINFNPASQGINNYTANSNAPAFGSQKEKLVAKFMDFRQKHGCTGEDAKRALKMMGFEARAGNGGSHRAFVNANGDLVVLSGHNDKQPIDPGCFSDISEAIKKFNKRKPA